MITFLIGSVAVKEAPVLHLQVQGIGYELRVPISNFHAIPDIGQEIKLYTHIVYREDAQNLFGFLAIRDRNFFRELIKINGVGPNLALTLLSGFSVDDCIHAVQQKDIPSFVQLPGIGKRTAERLIVELQTRVEAFMNPNSVGGDIAQFCGPRTVVDAEAGLISLGYKPAEAKKAVARAVEICAEPASSEELIRQALSQLLRAS